jgi:hypothetical protein
MKRAWEEDIIVIPTTTTASEANESLWEELLCTDVQHCIIAMLDPLASLLFKLTSKKNYTFISELPIPVPIPRYMDMEELIFRYGTVDLIKQILPRREWKMSGLPSAYAAQEGNLDLLKWMLDDHYVVYSITLDYAAMGGQLRVMKWLKEIEKLYWTKQTLQQAVMYGSVENLEWMIANGCPEPHIQEMCALQKGHLHVLKWLHERGHKMYRQELLPTARGMNRPDIVQWIEETLMVHIEPVNIYRDMIYWQQEFEPGRDVALPDNDDDDI